MQREIEVLVYLFIIIIFCPLLCNQFQLYLGTGQG